MSLAASAEPGLLGFDADLARPYAGRPLRSLLDAIRYLIAVVGMAVSFAIIWPLSVLGL